MVLLAKRDRRLVHHLQLRHHHVAMRDLGVQRRILFLLGVGGVHALHARRLDDHVGLDLDGTKHGGRVGGKVRIAGTGGKDHGLVFLEMTERPPPDIWLGQLLHPDRGHHARFDSLALENILERERVDHRAQHAHVVGADSLHSHLGELAASYDVAASDHETDRGPQLYDVDDFVTQTIHRVEIESKSLVTGERFAREFDEDAGVFEIHKKRRLSAYRLVNVRQHDSTS